MDEYPEWFEKVWLATVDHPALQQAPLTIPPSERRGGLFDVRKPLARDMEVDTPPAAIATRALKIHADATVTRPAGASSPRESCHGV